MERDTGWGKFNEVNVFYYYLDFYSLGYFVDYGMISRVSPFLGDST